jgi:protein-tyrosine-phosphatase
VLFVCQAGTVKSAVARELFRRRAKERSIEVIAFSRGIAPVDHVSPDLKAHLSADGIDSNRDGLHKLSRADVESADLIVAFDALPSDIDAPRLLDWSAVPSLNEAYPASRADLARRIDALLDKLRAGK